MFKHIVKQIPFHSERDILKVFRLKHIGHKAFGLFSPLAAVCVKHHRPRYSSYGQHDRYASVHLLRYSISDRYAVNRRTELLMQSSRDYQAAVMSGRIDQSGAIGNLLRPAFLVNYHLFQQLTVNLCAVAVRQGCFLNISDVAPDPVKLLLVGGVDVLTFAICSVSFNISSS